MGQKKRSSIGIMGGSFDPIHFGHLLAAQQALERCGLERALFMPAGIPPHKPMKTRSTAKDRIQMARLAIKGNPAFELSLLEVRRKGKSYTVDTARQLLEVYPPSRYRLRFIVGADAALDIPDWKSPEELLNIAEFIVIPRPGFDPGSIQKGPGPAWRRKIRILDAPRLDISSSEIRRRVREGKSLRYLTPDPVVSYIEKRGLYAGSNER